MRHDDWTLDDAMDRAISTTLTRRVPQDVDDAMADAACCHPAALEALGYEPVCLCDGQQIVSTGWIHATGLTRLR